MHCWTLLYFLLQLERLQADNSSEWQRREELESEKQSQERENRQLRTQIGDLEEQLQVEHQVLMANMGTDLRAVQFDLSEKSKVRASFLLWIYIIALYFVLSALHWIGFHWQMCLYCICVTFYKNEWHFAFVY